MGVAIFLAQIFPHLANTMRILSCLNADYFRDSQCDKVGLNLSVFLCLPLKGSACKPCSRRQTPENAHFPLNVVEFEKRTPPARNPARKTPILRSCHSDFTFGCRHVSSPASCFLFKIVSCLLSSGNMKFLPELQNVTDLGCLIYLCKDSE